MKTDGFSLDDKRSPLGQSDIPDIIKRFNDFTGEEKREQAKQSLFVPKDEIVSNDYDLSINKYKKIEYVREEYPPTSQILAEIRALETEIQQGISELENC